jgi:16S rRNA (adenine1518-N6/adenine1519-N6)-dimethyltransferase
MRLQDLCKKYDISFKKGLGQNLLLDDNINRIMVDAAAITKNDDIVEVGPGLGALTLHMQPLAGRLLAVEIDRAFIPCLLDQFSDKENVRIFRGDVLNHSVPKLLREYIPDGTSYKLVSNLPYYITTPILFHFWESTVPFARIVVMMQEEVAQRMTAAVNADDYGVLTLAAALYGKVDIVHRVPRTCFVPKPNVDSCIVRLRRHETPLYPDVEAAFILRLIRAAFTQRRKTLRNSLLKSGQFGAPQEAVSAALDSSEIDPQRRPQTVSLDEFARLAAEIKRRM